MIISVKGNNFREEAVNTDKLVLVDFYATWCGPCKALAPVLEEVSEKYSDSIKIVKVDVDEEESIAAKFGIVSIPTIVFLKNGQTVTSFVGLKSAAEIEKLVEKNLGWTRGTKQLSCLSQMIFVKGENRRTGRISLGYSSKRRHRRFVWVRIIVGRKQKKELLQNCCKYTSVFRGFLLSGYDILQS